MDRDSTPWLLPILLAAGVAAAAWYYWSNIKQQLPDSATFEQSAPQPAAKPAVMASPMHPIEAVSFPDSAIADLRPLPGLDDSDEYFKLELTDLFGEQIGALIAGSRIVERVVATVDNLPRSHVAERIRPVTGLTDAFVADPEGGDLFVISEESYRRYDALVSIIEESDVGELADLYRRYYPLFQKAYEELGYPNGYFNDRLVAVIDDLLATPELSGKVLLIRPHVLYEFQDPDIEARSSGQKLMLRIGNENAAKIKTKLRELRDVIASEDIQ
jgi:DUF3014 family protein